MKRLSRYRKIEGRFSRGEPRGGISFLLSAARPVARGIIKPHDWRYRNRLPWLSYVICFTSWVACERGQTSGRFERKRTLLRESYSATSFTIAFRFLRPADNRPEGLELVPIETVLNRVRPARKKRVQGVYGRGTARCRGIVLVCRLGTK